MMKLRGHTLEPGEKFAPESNGLTLQERASTAKITLGPGQPELAMDDWVLEEKGPGAGIVWRVKAVETTYNTRTRVITLEHAINTLRDVSMFGEVTAAEMGGGVECAAEQAARYVLGQQSIWTLGDFEFSTDAAYKFNGEDLFTALQTITSTLDDPWWDYDMSALPFKLHIRQKKNSPLCEMRMGRNLSTLRKTVDRSQMYTRIYPIGENDLHISGDYLSKNENLYGRKDKVLTDTSQDNETMLRIWAQEKLDRHCEPTVTITISGLELSEATGESLDHLVLGRVCRVPLPEFGTTITERITKLNWKDAENEPENVTVTLCNTLQDIASIINKAISEGSGSSGSASRTKAKKDGEDHAWFIDTESHVGMVAEAIIGQGPDGVDWSRVAEIIVDGEGIHQQVVLAQGSIITMQGRQDMTEESLTTVFEKTGIGSLDAGQTLYGMQVMSAESLYTVFEKTGVGSLGAGETLYGMQRMNAESLVTVFQKTGIDSLGNSETLYGLQHLSAESLTTIFRKTGVDSLGNGETLYSRQVMTAESMTTVFSKTGINSLGQNETLYTKVTTEAGRINQIVQGVGADGKVTAASIVQSINNGESSIMLDADRVRLASTGGSTVTLSDRVAIDTNGYILLKATTIVQGPLDIQGNYSVSARQFVVGTGGYLRLIGNSTGEYYDLTASNMKNAVTALQITQSGDTYTLQKKTIYNSASWTDVGNFSRATTLTGAWSGGVFTVTAAPQNATKTTRIYQSNVSGYETTWSGNTAIVPICYGDDAQHPAKTGYTVTVDASARYTAGQNSVSVTKGSWSGGQITFTPSAGTGASKSISLSAGTVSWDGNSASVPIRDYTGSSYLSTGYTVTVDASARYTAGYNAGYSDGQGSVDTNRSYVQGNQDTIRNMAFKGYEYNSSTSQWDAVNMKDKTIYLSAGSWSNVYVQVYDYDQGQWITWTGKYESQVSADDITCSSSASSIGTNRGNRTYAGTISKSGLAANSYLGFEIQCGGAYKQFYITVNA